MKYRPTYHYSTMMKCAASRYITKASFSLFAIMLFLFIAGELPNALSVLGFINSSTLKDIFRSADPSHMENIHWFKIAIASADYRQGIYAILNVKAQYTLIFVIGFSLLVISQSPSRQKFWFSAFLKSISAVFCIFLAHHLPVGESVLLNALLVLGAVIIGLILFAASDLRLPLQMSETLCQFVIVSLVLVSALALNSRFYCAQPSFTTPLLGNYIENCKGGNDGVL